MKMSLGVRLFVLVRLGLIQKALRVTSGSPQGGEKAHAWKHLLCAWGT